MMVDLSTILYITKYHTITSQYIAIYDKLRYITKMFYLILLTICSKSEERI